MVDDPDLHPREVEFIEPVRHRVNLVTGEETIEPLDDQQVRTASIVSVGPDNPQGNIHRAGSVLISVDPDSVNLESATRRRDANLQDLGEAEAFDLDAAIARAEEQRRAELATGAQGIQDIRRQDQAGAPGFDYDAAFAQAEERRQAELATAAQGIQEIRPQQQNGDPSFDYDAAFARAEEQRQAAAPPGDYPEQPRTQAEIERFNRDYRRVVGQEPTGNLRQDLRTYRTARSRSASTGPGGVSANVESPSGQGATRSSGRPRSANNSVDTGGLMGGGRSRTRGGGGRRRRDEEDEDGPYRRPEITVVIGEG